MNRILGSLLLIFSVYVLLVVAMSEKEIPAVEFIRGLSFYLFLLLFALDLVVFDENIYTDRRSDEQELKRLLGLESDLKRILRPVLHVFMGANAALFLIFSVMLHTT